MRDNIIICLWIAYTIGFGLLGVYLDPKADAIEMFAVSCLFAQILLRIYLLLVAGFNELMSKIKFRIKLSPPKRFKNKVTPIYKLITYEEAKNWFSISKYQLEWTDFGATNYRFWLLPFITLFQRYKYVPVDCYYEFEMDLDKVENIGLLWEIEDTKKQRKEDELKSAAEKELEKVNKLNEVFLENYE